MSTPGAEPRHPAISPLPAQAPLPAALKLNPRLSTWLRFAGDRVEVRTGKVEIGQGIVTALAQVAADSLGVRFDRIRMVPATTAGSPDEGITSGSRSTNESGIALRVVCAQARARLLDAAAAQLGCTAADLSVDDGRILLRGQPTGLDYCKLPHASVLDADVAPGLVPMPQRLAVGQPVPRLDLPAKVAGQPAFVQDMVLPGMLFGRVVRSPEGREVLTRLDLAPLAGMPGIVAAVRDGSFVGIVAEREEQAVRARARALELAQWQPREHFTDSGSVHAWLQEQPSKADPVITVGDEAARARVTTRHSARYTKPSIAHASLAPSCALARIVDGQVEVWCHSQSIHLLRHELARALRIPVEQVTVHHAEGSGCYGHNGADDVALDAALLSRAVGGRPVHVQWMRDDEFAWEPFGPAMVVEVQAGLDAEGRIADWSLDAWGNGHLSRPGVARETGEFSALLAAWQLEHPHPRPAQRDPGFVHGIAHGGLGRNAATAIYALPNQRVTLHRVKDLPLRGSSLRGLGAYANAFAIESFLDELAQQAGADPLAFRLRHLVDPRARAVLERAAQEAGWGSAPSADGVGRGLACAQYCNHLGYFACVVDLRVDPDLRVERVVAAVDVGRVINPDGVRNQAEGGIVQAISWTLKEQVRFRRDAQETRTWEDYPILGFAEVPRVEVHLIDRPDEEPIGAGEMTMGPIAAAIANAAADALGVRVRDLPITRDSILRAE
jgi:CO/xanthine dehydrogenase Mo-binding subunit